MKNGTINKNRINIWIARYDLSEISKEEKVKNAEIILQQIEEFIAQSRKAIERIIKRKRNFRRIAFATVTAVIIGLLGFSYYAINEKNKAIAQAKLIADLQKQIDEGAAVFDKMDNVIIPESKIVFLGMEYKATVFMAAYNSKFLPIVKIGNYDSVLNMIGNYDTLPIIDGKAFFSIKPKAEGKHEWRGIIEQPTPSGKSIKSPFINEFLAMKPNLVVTPITQNILWRGLENPVAVSVGGLPPEKLIVKVRNGIVKGSNGKYSIRPGNEKECFIAASRETPEGKEQRFGEFRFRVKNVPDPKPTFAGYPGGEISIEKIKETNEVKATLDNFEFEGVRFEIVSFSITFLLKGNLVTKFVNGSKIPEDVKNALNMMKNGQRFYIEEIQVKGPDGNLRNIGSILFRATTEE